MAPDSSYSYFIRRSTGGAEATYQLWRAAATFSDDDSYKTHLARPIAVQFNSAQLLPLYRDIEHHGLRV